MELEKFLRANYPKSEFHYLLCRCMYEIWLWKNYRRFEQEDIIRRRFKRVFGRDINLQDPKTLNEKIQWLKLYEYHDYDTILADKYAMKAWVATKFGDQYNVPLIYHTSNWRDITAENIREFPCVVKANHSSHDYVILRNPHDVDWKALQRTCRFWLHRNYYLESQEQQYRDIPRQIVVEKLLVTKSGKIPNDYKLNYINGELQFTYVSIDREGLNVRNVYDRDWNPIHMDWDSSNAKDLKARVVEVEKPESYDLMCKFGNEIATLYKYIRVDYYDVDGKLYFGEITLHHGGGYDRIRPIEYDEYYGSVLKL